MEHWSGLLGSGITKGEGKTNKGVFGRGARQNDKAVNPYTRRSGEIYSSNRLDPQNHPQIPSRD